MSESLIFLLIISVLAVLYKLFPPKKANALYGYRTRKSRLNQNNWDTANRIASNILLMGATLMAVTYITIDLVYKKNSVNILASILGITLALTLAIVEYKLRKQ